MMDARSNGEVMPQKQNDSLSSVAEDIKAMKLTQPLKPEVEEKIEAEVTAIVTQFQEGSGYELESVVERISHLGEVTQEKSGMTLELLRRPVRELMTSKHDDVSQGLLKLRSVVDEIQPNRFFQRGGLSQFLYKMMGNNPLVRYIRTYESVETQIQRTIDGLRYGRDRLEEDSIQLKQIRAEAFQQVEALEARIALGKHLLERLDELYRQTTDEVRKMHIEKAMAKVTVRVRNMMQMVNILLQAIASTDLLRENNDQLKEAVMNAITMTQNVVTVSAAIQMALAHQKKVAQAVKGVNEATEQMILSNAATLKTNTETITKMLEEPAIAIQTLQKAFDDLMSAIQTSEASSRRIVESGRKFMQDMDELNARMRERLEGAPIVGALPEVSSGTGRELPDARSTEGAPASEQKVETLLD
ncbi:MAG: toxic anion resistance protein [Candidatus Carbobacillus altaicus]|nr:toxic anion resistance protein [Candidatus Carbobacillus altaicus]